ncbi:Coenzyme F420 hydrogenase/dehydrogenase, beta subunit C-terminal domain [Caballeronia sp. LjRoot34]|uniref:Coenzyme F420 hydrogenase/dehydrogenase, beta subunit C-terminal domain n=1 Tax=Caballeronia sp. LjRoot34 TaxID=3342325 RepID=UPI003ECCE8AF
MPNVVSKVVASGLCSGCGACAAAGSRGPVQMKLDPDGFLRPLVEGELSPGFTHAFRRICPGLTLRLRTDAPQTHAEWGPIHGVRTGWAVDPEIRYRGSSGGVLSALLIYLLESGKADFVAHVAVSTDDPLLNIRRISRTRDEVLSGAGSRYAPAAALDDIDALFELGGRFAFVGKPCDVAALRAYLAVHTERVSQVVMILSFMCAGVPSMAGTHEVLAALGTNAVETASFVYRGNGWPGFATARTFDGRELKMDYAASWGKILGKRLQLRCKVCPDGTGEFADITCADAWYGPGGYPNFEERAGRSLIISRTHAGEDLVRAALAAQAVCAQECAIDAIADMQPYQLMRKQVVLGRLAAVMVRRRIIPSYSGLRLWRAAHRGGWGGVLRNALGTFRRLG